MPEKKKKKKTSETKRLSTEMEDLMFMGPN